MWEALYETLAQADSFHQLLNALLCFPSLCEFECFERLTDYLSHSHPGIERGVRILENYLQVTTVFAHFPLRKLCQILIAIKHLAGGWFDKTENCSTQS